MAVIIDGFNLIYKFPSLETLMYENRLNDARKGLIEILNRFNEIKKEKIIVFFDGKKKPSDNTQKEKTGKILIYYSLDYSADFLIKNYIKQEENPAMATVVTSDKEIIASVSMYRAKVVTSENYARFVKNTIDEYNVLSSGEKEIDPVLSEKEISFWEKMFKNRK